MNLLDHLNSNDPLSDDAINCLLKHKEEDPFVDYKLTFNPADDADWLAFTVDVMAFSNTSGGYLIFGVKNKSFDVIGIPEKVLLTLTDTNMILQKLNRYISPPFVAIRTKKHNDSGKNIAIVHIPESKGKTHIVSKQAIIKYPSGDINRALYPGNIFVRHSGTNSIITPEALQFIIDKRIDYYKTTLLDRIAKVVSSPSQYELITYDPKSSKTPEGKYVKFSDDDPDAIPIKGISFTTKPKSEMEEISSFVALKGMAIPEPSRLWKLYARRKEFIPTKKHAGELIRFCILFKIPVYYWLKMIPPKDAKEIIISCLKEPVDIFVKAEIIHIGCNFGERFHSKLIDLMGASAESLAKRTRKFSEHPIEFYSEPYLRSKFKIKKNQLEEELTELAKKLSCGKPDSQDISIAHALDFYLYRQEKKDKGQEATN